MSMDALQQAQGNWFARGDSMTAQSFKIPKTYKVVKEDLTLEDVALIIKALDISICDNSPFFEKAKQQGLFDVSV